MIKRHTITVRVERVGSAPWARAECRCGWSSPHHVGKLPATSAGMRHLAAQGATRH